MHYFCQINMFHILQDLHWEENHIILLSPFSAEEPGFQPKIKGVGKAHFWEPERIKKGESLVHSLLNGGICIPNSSTDNCSLGILWGQSFITL